MIIKIDPVAKPRMTQRDKWQKRQCVVRYREFCDRLRAEGLVLPESYSVTFWIPMPKSWSNKKKARHSDQPHQQKPDLDNLIKAIQDAVCEDDSYVWNVCARKVWAYRGAIRVGEIR